MFLAAGVPCRPGAKQLAVLRGLHRVADKPHLGLRLLRASEDPAGGPLRALVPEGSHLALRSDLVRRRRQRRRRSCRDPAPPGPRGLSSRQMPGRLRAWTTSRPLKRPAALTGGGPLLTAARLGGQREAGLPLEAGVPHRVTPIRVTWGRCPATSPPASRRPACPISRAAAAGTPGSPCTCTYPPR